MTTLNKDGGLRNGGRLRADYLGPIEAHFVPALDRLGVQGLRDLLVQQGVRAPVASAIVVFIADHRDFRPDHLNGVTRTNYRRQLANLTRAIPGYVKVPWSGAAA